MTYSYDAFGQRVQKQISAGASTFIHLRRSRAICGGIFDWAKYLAVRDLLFDLGSSRKSPHGDRSEWDGGGGHDYLPFGEEILSGQAGRGTQWGPQADSVEPKFTGQIRDSETGNDYFHARYYMSSYGRFMSPDPANAGADPYNPQSWNAYAYVLGNPLNGTDPTGEGTIDCGGGVMADACVTADGPGPISTWAYPNSWGYLNYCAINPSCQQRNQSGWRRWWTINPESTTACDTATHEPPGVCGPPLHLS